MTGELAIQANLKAPCQQNEQRLKRLLHADQKFSTKNEQGVPSNIQASYLKMTHMTPGLTHAIHMLKLKTLQSLYQDTADILQQKICGQADYFVIHQGVLGLVSLEPLTCINNCRDYVCAYSKAWKNTVITGPGHHRSQQGSSPCELHPDSSEPRVVCAECSSSSICVLQIGPFAHPAFASPDGATCRVYIRYTLL